MSIKKQFLKTRPICKVSFRLLKEDVKNAKSVHITGEFNDWNKLETPMKKLKNGSFTITLDLEKNNEYQFRYLIDKQTWINDAEADKYVPSGFTGSQNSVVSV
ncbi:MAG: glycoside hydrolase [Desulfobacteraceae bacterium]|nr:isoamylase early set domain-containing protein [Desulfobacteraceae bacterium]MBC2755968.1 glycoside hydrolase [Desulfobacteraceae bacterium]